MGLDISAQTIAWIVSVAVLVGCWPLAQTLRHDKLQPLAAYLLFTSVLALVAAPVFWIALRLAAAWLGRAALEGAVPALAITALALLPGFFAARWIVRRPQWRRMPK
jgi:hypothetical protein